LFFPHSFSLVLHRFFSIDFRPTSLALLLFVSEKLHNHFGSFTQSHTHTQGVIPPFLFTFKQTKKNQVTTFELFVDGRKIRLVFDANVGIVFSSLLHSQFRGPMSGGIGWARIVRSIPKFFFFFFLKRMQSPHGLHLVLVRFVGRRAARSRSLFMCILCVSSFL